MTANASSEARGAPALSPFCRRCATNARRLRSATSDRSLGACPATAHRLSTGSFGRERRWTPEQSAVMLHGGRQPRDSSECQPHFLFPGISEFHNAKELFLTFLCFCWLWRSILHRRFPCCPNIRIPVLGGTASSFQQKHGIVVSIFLPLLFHSSSRVSAGTGAPSWRAAPVSSLLAGRCWHRPPPAGQVCT